MDVKDFAEIAPVLRIRDDVELAGGSWGEDARVALAEHGAVLLRGAIRADDAVERAMAVLSDDLLDDAFWSTPRKQVKGKTLTATEFPSPRTIAPHSEMAYMAVWPRLVAFHSLQVAEEGGQTTICDLDAVSNELGDRLKPFAEKGVTYRRTFQKGIDIPWQHAFQSENRADVEAVGKRFDMKVEWLPGDALATSHNAQGTVTTEDGRLLYFNQSHLFHASLLDPRIRDGIERLHGPGRLPRSVTFGDGTPIPDSDIAAINATFEGVQTGMHWREGDVLILDNMRYAHGRLPFKGGRRLHVAMAGQERRATREPIAG